MDAIEIAKFIDHTELKPDSPYGRYTELCREALKYEFQSVCVNSFYVPLVKHFLLGFGHTNKIKVCSVVGFPFGSSSLLSKVVEAGDASANGADEIDVVINIGALKTQAYKRVQDELRSLRDIVKDKTLKVILEVGLLSSEEVKAACDICIETKCNYVKTSTGVNVKLTGEDTIGHVKLLKDCVQGTSVKVKASGGIKTLETVKTLLSLGVDRIGTSSSVKIMNELRGE